MPGHRHSPVSTQAPGTHHPFCGREGSGSGSGNVSVDELIRKLKVQLSSPSLLLSPLIYEPSHAHSEQQHTSTSTYHKHAFAAIAPRSRWPEAYTVNRCGSESSSQHYPHTSTAAHPNTTIQLNITGNITAFPQFPPNAPTTVAASTAQLAARKDSCDNQIGPGVEQTVAQDTRAVAEGGHLYPFTSTPMSKHALEDIVRPVQPHPHLPCLFFQRL